MYRYMQIAEFPHALREQYDCIDCMNKNDYFFCEYKAFSSLYLNTENKGRTGDRQAGRLASRQVQSVSS